MSELSLPAYSIKSDSPKRKLRKTVEEMPEWGMLLFDKVMNEYGLEDGQVVDFNEVESYFDGRDDTTSGVFFGNLQADNTCIPVAMKPQSEVATIIRELEISRRLNRESDIKTYSPMGLLQDEEGLCSISKFEENVVSCDTMTDRATNRKKIMYVLGIGAISLAGLHAAGVVHGDAQIKNTAFDRTTGEARAIDLTSSYFDKSTRGMLDDVASYIRTLPTYEISSYISGKDVLNHFSDPYLSLIRDALSAERHNKIHRAIRETLLD